MSLSYGYDSRSVGWSGTLGSRLQKPCRRSRDAESNKPHDITAGPNFGRILKLESLAKELYHKTSTIDNNIAAPMVQFLTRGSVTLVSLLLNLLAQSRQRPAMKSSGLIYLKKPLMQDEKNGWKPLIRAAGFSLRGLAFSGQSNLCVFHDASHYPHC